MEFVTNHGAAARMASRRALASHGFAALRAAAGIAFAGRRAASIPALIRPVIPVTT